MHSIEVGYSVDIDWCPERQKRLQKALSVNLEGPGNPGEMAAGPIMFKISKKRFLQLRR